MRRMGRPIVSLDFLCYNDSGRLFYIAGLRDRIFIHMALTTQQKLKVLEPVRIHDKDTGSAEAQIALFTKEIEFLTKHLKKHGKDNSSRLGLLKMVSKRKRLMDFLKRDNPKRHASLSKKLGL
jgi:small subunit ribosomal protein S15